MDLYWATIITIGSYRVKAPQPLARVGRMLAERMDAGCRAKKVKCTPYPDNQQICSDDFSRCQITR